MILRAAAGLLGFLVLLSALAGCGRSEDMSVQAPAGTQGNASEQAVPAQPEPAAPPAPSAEADNEATADEQADEGATVLEPEQPGSRRYALVFGNGEYPHGDALPAAPKDAVLIAKSLRNRGYHVLLALNRRLSQMQEDLHAFADMSKGAEVRVVYFAGHGFEFGRDNYLMPVDLPASITSLTAEQVEFNALRLQDVAWPLEQEQGVVLAIIDACRVGPSRGSSRALALGPAPAPNGTILAYATAPGSTAADSLRSYGVDRDNSPFTYFLAGSLEDPAIQGWDEALLSAANIVRRQTNGAQTPWMNASVSSFPAIGDLRGSKGTTHESGLMTVFSGMSADRRAAANYWSAHESRIWRIANDRQTFDDELQERADNGDDEAALALAYRWSDMPGKEPLALPILERLAEEGDAIAQLTLGTTLYALPARDSQGRKASYWWHQASANGVGEARAKLALIDGTGNMDALEEFAKGIIEIYSTQSADLSPQDGEPDSSTRKTLK